MTGSWTQSFCSSVRIQIHGLSGYLLLQFWSYSFNILQDVYTHNEGVHVHRILMVRWGHNLCLTDTLHFLKITPNKTTLSIIIKCGGILLFQLIMSSLSNWTLCRKIKRVFFSHFVRQHQFGLTVSHEILIQCKNR